MSPITHGLLSWAIADRLGLQSRDRNLVAWAGVLADIDGLGLLGDIVVDAVKGYSPLWYFKYHHVLLHGITGAILIAFLLCLCGRRKPLVFAYAILMVHLHLVCDLLGSRGPTPADIWPIYYLWPCLPNYTMAWSGQWRLDSWQNASLSLFLFGLVLFSAIRRGYSPLIMLSARADAHFVAVLRQWWLRMRQQLQHPL